MQPIYLSTTDTFIIYIPGSVCCSRLWFLLKCLSVVSHHPLYVKHISIKYSVWTLYAFQKIQWHHQKQLWPLCFSAGWLHCPFILTCDQSYGFFIMAWDREADCQSVWNKTAFRSVKKTYWHGTIKLIKSEGTVGFISTSVIVLAALCRNNYDVFCMPSQYITICMRFTSTESKRKESAKKLEAFQSRWASRDIYAIYSKLCSYTKSGDRRR